MYCPKCSQQQVSYEVRFCSRCGLPLSAVRELVVGGALAERRAGAQGDQLSPALRGTRKGVWIMLASFPLALITGLLAAIDDVFAVFILLPVLCFVAGFARLLYGTFREGRAPRIQEDLSQPHAASVMPPARVPPIEGFTEQRMITAEVVEPPSVTENTTRFLDEKAESHRG